MLTRLGVPVLPVNPETKKPLITSWKDLQTSAATEEQVEEWLKNWPNAGLAMVTGELSGLCVLDVDVEKGGEPAGWTGLARTGFSMPSADNVVPVSKSPSAGFHFYYPHTPDIPQGTGIWGIPNLDGRADGGYIIVPPTPGYRWLRRYASWADVAAGRWAER